jgi:hypothetical protein
MGNCGECAAHGVYLCDSCHFCDSDCDCEPDIEEEDVPHVRGPHPPRFHTATRKDRKENPSKRYIAVELEVCGMNQSAGHRGGNALARTVAGWGGAIVGDGSLPDGGFEINTAPASGDLFLRQVQEICAELERGGAWVDGSAGMHVHVDARDMRYYDMRRLVKLYAHVETQLYRTCKTQRRQSRYCTPCGQLFGKSLAIALTPKASKHRLLRNVYGERAGRHFPAIKRDKYQATRYHALNLHSWLHRGTVECRMYHGTVDPASATAWGMLWAGLLDCASARTEREVDAIVAEKEPREVLLACAPTDKVRRWLQSRWNLLSREHDTFEAEERERAAWKESQRRESIEYARADHVLRMRRIAPYIGLHSIPAWAFDYDTDPHTGVYRFLGPDDIHAAEFGDESEER